MAPVSQLILDQMICMCHSRVWLRELKRNRHRGARCFIPLNRVGRSCSLNQHMERTQQCAALDNMSHVPFGHREFGFSRPARDFVWWKTKSDAWKCRASVDTKAPYKTMLSSRESLSESLQGERGRAHSEPVVLHETTGVSRVGVPVPPEQAGHVGVREAGGIVACRQRGVVVPHVLGHV